ncbi:Asp-tRNA(Asn)/Glu-tRNA(Gln) amidotransferase subunit GatB [Polluticaenibacter yanchengensis]|uniref:Aspartyl/glutamyl-tRNA(Asn/Gln) amidotransferase subunit B n=1 Tax=Polluticaenibacter yanchengensis TaxID=3014562 RepID=A0ABT4UQW9_9BACT|nr:Asp-tRNA(Asn)/Glu-tRNA(Gln) amidotransferase subunit GatB [Chitinophagaceae bacterium LY-5]
MDFDIVIGLEVHIQLSTDTKLFCGDSAAFGGSPNSHISPVTLALPGTLPVLNKKAVEYAVKLGLSLGCEINKHSFFDRKHYFYPDLPKGYQTSQSSNPVCLGGGIKVNVEGEEKYLAIHHIHLEEDAGKSIHDADPKYTCIDLNRAGVPLMELVTEPVLSSSAEAFAFLTELRKLVRWIEVCDGNMEEGSLRCDANVSIKPKGAVQLGTKVEVKNLNSIRNVRRAIDAEVERQVKLVTSGGAVVQETRGYDADKNITLGQREKELANDYRYLPCPDLPPFEITKEELVRVKATIPKLPQFLYDNYVNEYQLPAQDAQVLTEEKSISDFFNTVAGKNNNYKAVANWILGPVKSLLNEKSVGIEELALSPEKLSDIIDLVASGAVNFSTASGKLLPAILGNDKDVKALASELGLVQVNSESDIEVWVDEVLAKMQDKVAEYKKGKKGLIGLFVGEVKKISKGKADPKKTTDILQQKLQ